jgi:adenine-specific DNA-methyltransferase
MMDKMKMQSPNLTDENIDKIAEIFPGCVTESRNEDGSLKKAIDFDLLKQELSTSIVEGPQELYHLNWPGKRQALLTANAPIAKTLRPCRDESVNFDTTENLFIEGDNLDALKLLQETYLGKVKMIYIDPPYNTGKDFIYSDNFAESTEEYLLNSGQKDEEGNRLVANKDSNGRFHSDWLSMMYSRLKLARNLLKDDGVIFISIDDRESGNVRKLCDEVFGGNNFVANVIWEKKYSPQNDAKWFSDNHDHIFVYSKEKEFWRPVLLPRSEKADSRYKNPDNDPRGPWKPTDFSRKALLEHTIYDITLPSGRVVPPPNGRSWLKDKIGLNELIEDNRIYFGPNGDSVPSVKRFLSDVKDGTTPLTIWKYSDVGHNQTATKELKTLFETVSLFSSPKPVTLLKRVCYLATSKDDIILDFFAGSATTAHAVMQLNAEDNGKRKFIMIQLQETCGEKSEAFKAGYKTIAEISKERIRRAGKKIKEKNATTVSDLDTGFRVLKVDSSNMADVYFTPDAVEQDLLSLSTENIKDDRTCEDLLFQVLLDWGVDLTLPITQETIEGCMVFFVDGDALAGCFEKDGMITEVFCKELAERQPLRVVFRDSGFASDSVKINVEQIFKLKSPHTDVKTI